MTAGVDTNVVDSIRQWVTELRDLHEAEEAAQYGLAGWLFLFGIRYSPRRTLTHTPTQVMRMLNTDDKRALAPLLTALSLPLGRLRRYVLNAVIRLLYAFEKTDSLDILGTSRWRLFHMLEQENPNDDSSLLLAVLHALEMSGTTDDLRAMQFLSVRYRTNAEQQVVGAARKCALAINGRVGQERSRKVLLRATDEVRDPNELLRATRVLPYHEPEMLLRNVSPKPQE